MGKQLVNPCMVTSPALSALLRFAQITALSGCSSPAPGNAALVGIPSPAHILENSVRGTVRWSAVRW